jgi:hypothetical protein
MTSEQRRACAVLERRLSDRGDPERMEKEGGSALSAPQHRRKARVSHTGFDMGGRDCDLLRAHRGSHPAVESIRTPSWLALKQKHGRSWRVFALDVFSVTARRRPAATRWGPNRRRAPAGLARAARLRDRLAIRRAIALAAATGSVAAHATRPGIPSPDPHLAPASAARLSSGSGRSRLLLYVGTPLDRSPPF